MGTICTTAMLFESVCKSREASAGNRELQQFVSLKRKYMVLQLLHLQICTRLFEDDVLKRPQKTLHDHF